MTPLEIVHAADDRLVEAKARLEARALEVVDHHDGEYEECPPWVRGGIEEAAIDVLVAQAIYDAARKRNAGTRP